MADFRTDGGYLALEGGIEFLYGDIDIDAGTEQAVMHDIGLICCVLGENEMTRILCMEKNGKGFTGRRGIVCCSSCR